MTYMDLRQQPYRLFALLTIASFLVIDLGFEVFARLWFGRNLLLDAVGETLYYLISQPIGSLLLLAPVALLGWMSASLSIKKTSKLGMILFCLGLIALGLIYFWGHMGSQFAIQNHKWTASALSIGLVPYKSIPVLIVCLIARLFMGRRAKDTKEPGIDH
jgi:hypothetical protein